MKTVGAMLGQMSGSFGGITASHNRGGAYFRQRVVPTNPSTTRQANVRGYMSAAVSAWGALTDAVRAGWETYAANTPTTDSMGQTLVLTGQQIFIRAFVTLAMSGVAVPATAPTIFDTGQPVVGIVTNNTAAAATIGTLAGNLSITAQLMSATDSGGKLQLYLGKPVGTGVQFFKGPYQLAASVTFAGSATEVVITNGVADLTGGDPLVVGQRVPTRIVMAYTDGRVATAYRGIFPVVDDA